MHRRGLRGMYISKKAFRRHFDPCLYPDETYLLCELWWNGNETSWKHWVRNDVNHAEEYFLQEIFEPRSYGFCNITWYLSWSPCWSCCNKIRDFLRRHPNVSIDIHVARLYYSDYTRNQRGLRELEGLQRVTIQVMEEEDYHYCWETFLETDVYYDFLPENFGPAIRRYRLMLENILEDHRL
ncbi:C-_U-editing enzyme APOBEC-1-like [Chamaea fasciata]|uniref:C->U-editing enzyme APOBEC-1-like n=1 Tax=Chamaea fasciata TaxID=190680 RepID=UPI003369CED2